MLIYWGHRIGSPLARILPVWFTYAISEAFAPLIYLIWSQKRRNAIDNLQRVLGPDASRWRVRWLACRSFVNFGKYLIDMMRLGATPPDRVYTVDGWENLQAAYERGNGLIFIGGHIGNSDLGAAILAQRGYPVSVIAEPLSPPRWDRLVQQARAAAGLHVIPLGQAMLRSLRVLRERQVLAFLIDRPTEEGVTVEFFGHRTQVPGGAAVLALRSGATVIGGCIVRRGTRYVAEISPEIISPETTGDEDLDVQQLTQRLYSWLEQVIRNHPDQWFMFRQMWPEDSTGTMGTARI